MAHIVNDRPSLAVHQLVHGYFEGHRELAGSLRLTTRDARTVAILSDVSSSGLRVPEGGYLTGYPLPDSGLYVLARTWAATEVSRPGAVWTHSLLVEFSDLASIRDASVLTLLHRRPDVESSSWEHDYRRPFDIHGTYDADAHASSRAAEGIAAIDDVTTEWLTKVLSALYGQPSDRVVVMLPTNETVRVDDAILALWSQQWPRLRRSFRFCTATTSDRQAEKGTFDLQVCPDNERTSRSRFSGAFVVGEDRAVSAETWLVHAVDDLRRPGLSDLREFLVAVGSATGRGRSAFVPLVQMHEILSNEAVTAASAERVLSLVEEEFDTPPSLIVPVLTLALARHIEDMAREAQDYVLSNVDSLRDEDFGAIAPRLGKVVWGSSKLRFFDLVHGSERQRSIAADTIRTLPIEELVSGVQGFPDLTEHAACERPELLQERSLWSSSEAVIDAALRALSALNADVRSSTASAIVSADTAALHERARKVLGAETLWGAVVLAANAQPSGPSEPLRRWIQVLSGDTSELAGVLASGSIRWRTTLHEIAQIVGPDSVPNTVGDDPWLLSLQAATGDVESDRLVYLSSYLLCRALGPSSRNCAGLVEASFNTVYESAARDTMPISAWRLLAPRLPQPGYWQSWDRCKQLRYGVAQLYVGRSLSPASFARLGTSDHMFKLLARAAAKEWHGKDYLRDVRRALEYTAQGRIEAIDEQLHSWL